MNYKEIAKKTIGHLYQSHNSIRQSGIDTSLVALAELRVSQINGCAYCCHFHSGELRDMGIVQDLLDKLPGWKHSMIFNRKQVLTLKLAESISLLDNNTEVILEDMKNDFTEKEVVELTASIALMNALNRLRISLGDKV
ncbi:MAG TPA: carboxymuconolactone decarboxylase family protein [Sediminibacterium sp.]|nr:carboxymuconolactone decarboxylase family protein [Sediminibacterium sp.]